MADALRLKVVTPDEVVFEGAAVSITVPAALGYMGILVNHAPFLSTIGRGNLSFRDAAGTTRVMTIEGGFLEVLKNRVLVLTDKVGRPAEQAAPQYAA